MKLYIDCEFNEHQGELISMALVDEAGNAFYEVVDCEFPGPWVKEHVMPILGQRPVEKSVFEFRLQRFLFAYDHIHVVADWPADIALFCDALITGPGERIDTPPLTLEVRRDLHTAGSAVPHNALEDARAMRRMAMGS